MADQFSSYHSIVKPEHGKDPWSDDYYSYVDTVDRHLKKTGTLSNRPLSGDVPTNVWYEVTDENIIYRNDGTDGWVPIGHGSSGSRIPEGYFESLEAGSLTADGPVEVGVANGQDDGVWVGSKDNALTVDGTHVTQFSVESDGWEWVSDDNSSVGQFRQQMSLGHDGILKLPHAIPSAPEDVIRQSELTSHSGDSSAHHAKYTDSEARTAVEGNVDAADLTGASGTSGQVLETDGTNVSWQDVSGSNTQTAVSDDGTEIVANSSDIDFRGGQFDVTNPTGSDVDVVLTNDSVTVAGNTVALGGSTTVNHADLSNIGASDHHAKTTTLDDLTDTNVTDFTADTNANRPAAGTADRVYVETDTGRVLYDNGTSWVDVGVSGHGQLSGISSGDHHTRYSDSEAQTAVEGSVDAADLTGSSGTSGQVLETDGTNASWSDATGSSERKRETYYISSGSGTEVLKIGEFRQRNARFSIRVVGGQDQGSSSVRRTFVEGWKRGGNTGAEYFTVGSPYSNNEVNTILTETTNDANGDGYNDAYLYVICDDFADSKLILEYEGGFTDDFTSGLGTADIVGTEVFRSDGRGNGELSAGDIYSTNGITINSTNGVTFVDGSWIASDTGVTQIGTRGLSGDHIELYDAYNGQDILLANTGGNVDVPNGNITVSGTVDGVDVSAHAGNSSAHHSKTTTLDDLTDTNVTDFTADTNANRPAAGTADRVYVETDTGKVLYDNGTSWVDVGVSGHGQLANISSNDHHAKYTDSEARTAVENGSLDGVQFANHEHGDYDTDGFLYWDLSAGAYLKSSNASGSQTGGSLLWSSENFSAGNALAVTYDSEDKPTLDVSEGAINGANIAGSGGVSGQSLKTDGIGAFWDYSGPDRRELLGSASDTDGTTNLDVTLDTSATAPTDVEFTIDITGNDSSTTFGTFIQLNGDTGGNYDYNEVAAGSVTSHTGSARFTFQVWGSNRESNSFRVEAGSNQNFISQLTGSADNRNTIVSGDHTGSAAGGSIDQIRVYGNFNATADLYAVEIKGP